MCDNCRGFDTLSWREPTQSETPLPHGAEMLPLIVGKPAAPVAEPDEAEVVEAVAEEDSYNFV